MTLTPFERARRHARSGGGCSAAGGRRPRRERIEFRQDRRPVGVERVPRAVRPRRGQRHADRVACLDRVAQFGIRRDLDHGPAVPGVLVEAEPVFGCLADAGRSAGLLVDEPFPLPGRPGGHQLAEPLAHRRLDSCVGAHPLGIGPAVPDAFWQERPHEPVQVPWLHQAQLHPPAIRAPVVTDLRHRRWRRAALRGRRHVADLLRATPEQLERRIEKGHLDMLPDSGALPEQQRRQHAMTSLRSGEAGRYRQRGEPRLAWFAGLARREQARRRGDDAFPARQPAARIGAAEPGNGAVDQPRVAGQRRMRADTEPVRDARTPAFEDDIGGVDQPECQAAIGFGGEVEDDAPFVALQHRVGRMLPAGTAGRVNADDVRAQAGELHGREGAGDELAEVDNAQARQRLIHD